MNVLYLSLGTFYDLTDNSVHLDLLKQLAKAHEVWLVCKNEEMPTAITFEEGVHVLRVHTGEMKRVNLMMKGINTIMVEPQFMFAIRRYLRDVRFDLVLYTTPPITFASAVKYIRNRDRAFTYLMLKDIFPQNAVDLGMLNKRGSKGPLYRYFRMKEKELYRLSDYIGCMSPANVEYTLLHNPEIDSSKVGICPNAAFIRDMSCSSEKRAELRARYGIPLEKKVFVYGGNLGRPQDIPYVIECLDVCRNISDAFFLIVGSGTEFHLLEEYSVKMPDSNFKLLHRLPKRDYDMMIGSCDVGMIFLDHRFTIPNYPSRLLSYLAARIPVLCATDEATDVGATAEENGFGVTCSSASVESFRMGVLRMLSSDLNAMGKRGWDYLRKNYDVHLVAKQIEDIVQVRSTTERRYNGTGGQR